MEQGSPSDHYDFATDNAETSSGILPPFHYYFTLIILEPTSECRFCLLFVFQSLFQISHAAKKSNFWALQC